MRYTTQRGCSGLCRVRDSVVECGGGRRTPQGDGCGGAKGTVSAMGMNSKAWRRNNDGVLECARQSAASTPLWFCPNRQTHSLPIRIPIRSTASHEEPRNPQRRHLRSLNEWPWGAAFCRTARRDVSAIQRHQTKPARIRSGFEPAGGVRSAEDYQRTCSRKRSVTGICWVTEGDSSSMKYQRTPAFSAAFRMAGQFS